MKTLKGFVLALCMALSMTACSAQYDNTSAGNQSSNTSSVSQTTSQSESSSDNRESSASTPDSETTSNVGESDTAQSESDSDKQENGSANTPDSETTTSNVGTDNTPEETGSKILIAYFSCTNTTEGIALQIADITGADTYEIVPEVPYTDADLNYNNSSSRSTVEQNDSSARPAISGSVENMSDYDIVFVGYPIWWGQAPKIIYTFVESYDLSGKTIVPFCTSGSSGVGLSASNLHSSALSAVWLDGTRFSGSASRSSIEDWIGGLQIEIQ